jgi:hypothetical protein
MRLFWPWILGSTCLLAGCSASPRVPPGLPPPEYEQPEPAPWPPVAAPASGTGNVEPGRTPSDVRTDTPAIGQAGAPSD